MPLKKIARIVSAARKDADLARARASEAEFRRKVQADRRGTLSSFETVQHALEDRAKLEKREASRKAGPSRTAGASRAGASRKPAKKSK
jgi:hypothetical protein